RHEYGGGITLVAAADQVEAVDDEKILDRLIAVHHVPQLLGGGSGALERCVIRQLYCGNEVGLVFGRDEAGGDAYGQEANDSKQYYKCEDRDNAVPQREVHPTEKSACCPVESTIEAAENACKHSALVLAGFEQDCAQRRCKRQRDDTRQHYRDGDGNRE